MKILVMGTAGFIKMQVCESLLRSSLDTAI